MVITPIFEVFKVEEGVWRFRLRGRNRRIIIISEPYISKRNAELGIETMQGCIEEAVIIFVNEKQEVKKNG